MVGRANAYLQHIQELPYVRDARIETHRSDPPTLLVRTQDGRFQFALESMLSYLDRTLTNAIVARATGAPNQPLLLFTRYVSTKTGERLVAAGVNFVDLCGNIHLRLGEKYQTLLLGRREIRPGIEKKRTGPATIQVWATLLIRPEAMNWTVRRLAEASGVGKTAAAEALQRLLADGILQPLTGGGFHLAAPPALQQAFIRGYGEVLRPHINLGRYRSAVRDPEAFVQQFLRVAARDPWALTGGPAAYELDRFFRGEGTPIFVEPVALEGLRRELKLLPDKQGPITFLNLFGPSVLWAGPTRFPVAHPWLVYTELLHDGSPRALEGAEELRKRHLET